MRWEVSTTPPFFQAAFESFFSSRVSIGYPHRRKREEAFITQRIKPKWKKRVWNGCVCLIGEYTRLRCLGCSGLLHSGLALDNTDCCYYGKWVCSGGFKKREKNGALNRETFQRWPKGASRGSGPRTVRARNPAAKLSPLSLSPHKSPLQAVFFRRRKYADDLLAHQQET